MAKKPKKSDPETLTKPDPGGPKQETEGEVSGGSGTGKKPTGEPNAPQKSGVTTTPLSKALLAKEVVWRDPAKLKFPFASAVRKHTKEEDDDLRASINEHGILQPLLITPDDEVIEGHCRARIALDREMPAVPCIVVEGVSDEEAWEAAVKLNTDRRQLTREEKLHAIKALLQRNPKLSDRLIAKQARTNKGTVGRERKVLELTGQIPESDERRDGNGVARRASDNRKKGNTPANRTTKPGSSAPPATHTRTDETNDESDDPTVASGAALLSELVAAAGAIQPKVQGLIDLIRDGGPEAPSKVAVLKIADAFEQFAEDLNGAFAPGKDQDEDNTRTP